jgi:hypothetical protein
MTEITKKQLVAAAVETLRDPAVSEWYSKHLEGRGQGNTVSDVMAGILNKELTLLDGLMIVFITGLQFGENFEGTK